jgi:hypothetical protein
MAKETFLSYLNLQVDGRLPRNCRTLTIPRHPIEVWPAVFVPNLVNSESPDGIHVCRNWIIGYRHLILFWCLTAEACEDVERSLLNANEPIASFWLRRATRLMNGSTAAFLNMTRMDQQSCSGTLQSTLFLRRTGLSESFSIEHSRLSNALRNTTESMNALARASKSISADIVEARGAFEHANHYWQRVQMMSSEGLRPKGNQPGAFSAIGEKGASLPDDLKEDAMSSACDRCFGVSRKESMFIEEFRLSLHYTLGAVRADPTIEDRLTAEQLSWLEKGDNLMAAMVDELVDPPSFHPEA